MTPSGSYPSDEVTRIITGCAEVIFELTALTISLCAQIFCPYRSALTNLVTLQNACATRRQPPLVVSGDGDLKPGFSGPPGSEVKGFHPTGTDVPSNKEQSRMARTVRRSARTGKFVKAATAKRNSRTTTSEKVGRGTSNKTSVHRSAITGKFVTAATARRHPGTTIKQKV